MAKKELLTFSEIEDKLKALDNEGKKKEFLRNLYTDEAYNNLKKKIVEVYAPLLLKKPVDQYELVYDSLTEGLEPIYYWILDFMRDTSPGGLGLRVFKGPEEYEASVTSGYFGEIGQRATQMQQKAAEYLGAINQVIKSILNLLYDLKEFEIRINLYKDLKSDDDATRRGALYSLKALWRDRGDEKKGRGSINLLAQDLQFATIRDAFFYVEKPERVEVLDLNKRVKNILTVKLRDFNDWMEKSDIEIKKRYDIERAYLKSQVGSLKLYAGWEKTYIREEQKLKMKEFNIPDIVNSFSNIEIKLNLVGNSQPLSPPQLHHTYKDIKLKHQYHAVLVTDMDFRGVPSAVTTQGGKQYVHGGRAEIKFKSYAFDEIELSAIEARELYEDMNLVDEWVGVSLEELDKEIQAYLTPAKEEKKEEKKEFNIEWPFKGTFAGFKHILSPLQDLAEKLVKTSPPTEIIESDVKAHAAETSKTLLFVLYNIYKKSHGMLSV